MREAGHFFIAHCVTCRTAAAQCPLLPRLLRLRCWRMFTTSPNCYIPTEILPLLSGRPSDPCQHRRLPVQHRRDLRAVPLGPLIPRDAALPRARADGRSAGPPGLGGRRHPAQGGQVRRRGVLEGLLRARRDVLHRSAHHAPGGGEGRGLCHSVPTINEFGGVAGAWLQETPTGGER